MNPYERGCYGQGQYGAASRNGYQFERPYDDYSGSYPSYYPYSYERFDRVYYAPPDYSYSYNREYRTHRRPYWY